MLLVPNLAAAGLLLCAVLELRYLFRHTSFLVPEASAVSPKSRAVGFIALAALFSAVGIALTKGQLVLGTALGLGAATAVCHPVGAVVFLFSNLVIRPWEFFPEGTIMISLPRSLAALAFLSLLLSKLSSGNYEIPWNRMLTLFTLLCGWILFSNLFSPSMAESYGYLLVNFIPAAITIYLIAFSIIRPEEKALLRDVMLVSVCTIVFCAVVNTLQSPEEFERLTGLGMWQNSNDLGALLALIIPMLVYRFLRGSHSLPRTLGFLAVGSVVCLALWQSQSRGTILALGAAIMCFAFFCSRSKKIRFAAVILAVSVPLLFIANLQRHEADLGGSSSARMNFVVAGLRMVKVHPVFGVGANNYPKNFELYAPAFDEWGERTAHSAWILILSEAGLIGFVLFALLYFWALRIAWHIRFSQPEILLSLVSYGVAMSFLSHSYNILPYLAVVLALVAGRTNEGVVTPKAQEEPYSPGFGEYRYG